MFDIFKGKVAYKHANSIFLENEHHLKEIYVDEINKYELNQEYKLYIFIYIAMGNKSIETRINFGFSNLDNAIGFYDLINIDGIGIKTALKIIKNGYQELLSLVQENNSYEISQKYGLSNSITNAIIDFYCKKDLQNYDNDEIKRINAAINNLQQLGYSKQISTKVVWGRKDEILKNKFSDIFCLLIEDIKNARINS